MKKEFVPYELAVKLKALGFDEDCFGCYTKDGELSYDFSDNRGEGHYFQECSAPTFSQAFRWFREKHKLISDIEYQPINSQKWGFLTYVLGEEPDYEHWFYETYEETELACLDKLIEIVEAKSE